MGRIRATEFHHRLQFIRILRKYKITGGDGTSSYTVGLNFVFRNYKLAIFIDGGFLARKSKKNPLTKE